mmetsp:Transcript_15814/g.27808  ORF Transcript_15814/g.27808 Transcript_15814/m.27808 type:complete len:233 (-) Transcript_15814:1414-2112(-)
MANLQCTLHIISEQCDHGAAAVDLDTADTSVVRGRHHIRRSRGRACRSGSDRLGGLGLASFAASGHTTHSGGRALGGEELSRTAQLFGLRGRMYIDDLDHTLVGNDGEEFSVQVQVHGYTLRLTESDRAFHSASEVEDFHDAALGHEPHLVNHMGGIRNGHRHTTGVHRLESIESLQLHVHTVHLGHFATVADKAGVAHGQPTHLHACIHQDGVEGASDVQRHFGTAHLHHR